MDIGNLLAEADAEVAYDQDTFESFENITPATKAQHEDYEGRSGNIEQTSKNRSQILHEAAGHVRKLEERETKQLFRESAQQSIQEAIKIKEREESPIPTYRKDRELEEALNVLVDASEEVANFTANRTAEPTIQRDHVQSPASSKSDEEEDFADEIEVESNPSGSDEDDDVFNDETNRELIFAIHNEKPDKVQSILRKGANLKYQDRHGWSPLHWAASKGNIEIIELLINHRRSVQSKRVKSLMNLQDKLAGWTPLHVSYL
jgi:vacuolar-type H+-ATPase subunit I/STV1